MKAADRDLDYPSQASAGPIFYILLLMTAMSLISCKASSDDYIYLRGMQLKIADPMEMDRGRPCNLSRRRDLAPSALEYNEFQRRINKQTNLVVVPINIRCIAGLYTTREAKYWYRAGDPVAAYMVMYDKYKHINDICKNIKEISEVLIDASNVNTTGAVAKKVRYRVPELFFLQKVLVSQCAGTGISAPDDIPAARVHGYDPVALPKLPKPA